MSEPTIVMAGSFTFRSPVRVGIHHYAACFARSGWRVCFLSSQLSPLHLLRKADRMHAREKARLWRRGGEWREKIFAYSYGTWLPILPFATPGFVVTHTLDCTLPNLRRVLGRQGFDRPDVLWIENPHASALPRVLAPRVLAYRVADEIRGFEGYPRAVLDRYHQALDAADLVVTTARPLFEKYSAQRPDGTVLYVPNGVDFEHFHAGAPEPPAEYRGVSRPIALYAGSLAPWLDQDLVAACARRLPQFTFVFLGPASVDTSRLREAPNVRLLGSRPYEALPAFYRHADVGIIPFKVNALVHAVNPVKLYEYLAAGLPVVATDWRELRELQSPARLATGTEAFCGQLTAALATRNARALHDYAREQDWSGRFDVILDALQACRTGKESGAT